MSNSRNFKSGLMVIISVCISLFFGYATYLFLQGYTDFDVETQRLRIAHDQIGQAKKQRQRVDQYNASMMALGKFTSQVKQFGLAPERWQTYDVSVNRSLSFYEAGNIIDQLSHSKTFYFQPMSLYIGSGAYRDKPVETVSATKTSSGVFDPLGVAPVEAAETNPVELQNSHAAVTQPAAVSGIDLQIGDLTLEVQGRFIVRGGS